MNPLTLAGQLAVIGGEQLALAAGQTLIAVILFAGALWAIVRVARWTRETMRAYPHRYEAPALDASVARHPAGKKRTAPEQTDEVTEILARWMAEWEHRQEGEGRG